MTNSLQLTNANGLPVFIATEQENGQYLVASNGKFGMTSLETVLRTARQLWNAGKVEVAYGTLANDL